MVHGGKVMALWQPSELLIIGGAALGGFCHRQRSRHRDEGIQKCAQFVKGI